MKEQQDLQQEQLDKIGLSLNNLRNKKFKILFTLPNIDTPVASIYEIYYHAYVLKQLGYEVVMLKESEEYKIPTWIEKELVDFPHDSIEKTRLSVAPEDMLIISESFTNIMEQTKNLPCTRIVMCHSIDYAMNALVPSSSWGSFGIDNVICVSQRNANMIESFFGPSMQIMGGKYNIKNYTLGIPDYFKKSTKPLRPVISIVGRNPHEITKVIKLFYLKYPMYSWITFETMLTDTKPPKPLTRKEFAKKLSNNFAVLWLDRISSYGTVPLEAMKVGSLIIGLRPEIVPEYLMDADEKMLQNTGIWTDEIYGIPDAIMFAIVKFLEDGIPEDIYKTTKQIADNHKMDDAFNQIAQIYESYVFDRIRIFEEVLKKSDNKEEEIKQQ